MFFWGDDWYICCLFFLFFVCCNSLIHVPNDILYGVTSGFIFSTIQSVVSLQFKNEYMPRAVVQLVKIFFNWLLNDWTVKHEWKISRQRCEMLVYCQWKSWKKIYNTHIKLIRLLSIWPTYNSYTNILHLMF